MPLKAGNWCLGCGTLDDEPAGEGCRNPVWHAPNLAEATAESERERQRVRLPYAEDRD